MKQKAVDRWAYVRRYVLLMLWCTFLVGLPIGSYAAGLPTSAQPPSGDWTVMHPSSFAGSVDSAGEQCARDSTVSSSDALTLEKCQVFEYLLKKGLCPLVMVPDKVVLDYLNGRSRGESVISFNKRKMTGREDRALLCDLGDGLHGYWFTGVKGQSCNNVAFVLPPPPVLPAVPEVIPPVVLQPPPRTYFSNPINSGMTQVLTTGVLLDNCCCPASSQIVGGSVVIQDSGTLQSHGYSDQ
ncbi:MAG: hypothetical protein RLZZ230_327 [Candidatus Parcubacteria bacterium]|jgi:hypothetical protein